jgi:hypothetical protein
MGQTEHDLLSKTWRMIEYVSPVWAAGKAVVFQTKLGAMA